MQSPKVLLRRIKAYRAIFGAVGAEMKHAGIVSKKGDPKRYTFFSNAWWAFFLLALLVPEPYLDPTVYFVSILALTVAWLFAVLQYQGTIAGDSDLLAIRGRIEVLTNDLNDRLRKEGFDIPETTQEQLGEFRTNATPETVRTLARSVFRYWALILSQRAILAAIVSIVGLLWGPALSRLHIGYWSAVSLLYALTFPYAVLLMAMILVILVVHYYVARVRADMLAAENTKTSPTPPP
jgi:hypothetical protein